MTTQETAETIDTTSRGLGRRTVLKGAAWSAPAVLAVGVTMPVAASPGLAVGVTMPVAASPVPFKPLTASPNITLTRGTGNASKTISFDWSVTNPAKNPAVTFSVALGTYTLTSTPSPTTIEAGQTAGFTLSFDEGNSSDALLGFTIIITCTIPGGTQPTTQTWSVLASSVDTSLSFTLGGVTYSPAADEQTVGNAEAKTSTKETQPKAPADEVSRETQPKAPADETLVEQPRRQAASVETVSAEPAMSQPVETVAAEPVVEATAEALEPTTP